MTLIVTLSILGGLIALLAYLLGVFVENVAPIAHTQSLIVGRANLTKVVFQRFRDVKSSFEKALHSPGWVKLRSGSNVTIDTLMEHDEGPLFIRTIATFEAAPATVFNAFSWDRFDGIQRTIDPFYESAQLLVDVSKNLKLIRKVSEELPPKYSSLTRATRRLPSVLSYIRSGCFTRLS